MLVTGALSRRPRRHCDDIDPTERFAAVVGEVGRSPLDVLRRTAAEALLLCEAHSAGVSTLEGGCQAEHQTPRCRAAVGPWASHTGSTVPRTFSPEGLTIDGNSTQLFHAPDRYYPHLREAQPSASEILLVPFDRSAGLPGVVWVVLHDNSRQFGPDEARRLQALTRCASVVFSVATSVQVNATTRPLLAPVNAPRRRLSAREEQVCILIAQGHTNKEIGELIGVSGKSVETYRARVADKLNFRTRADYVQFALAQGWLHRSPGHASLT